MADFAAMQEAVIKGNLGEATRLTQEALDGGTAPAAIVNEGLIPGMLVVGERFKNNEYYVPEVLIAARAMKGAMALVQPHLKEGDIEPLGTVAIGTVQGDLHDIGKNLVAMMLEGAGYKIVDLGVDVSPEKFIDAVQSQGVTVIALSALLTTTMPSIGKTIEALNAAGLREKVTVIIGGAPVTEAYRKEVGADAYAPDAGSAVEALKGLAA
ncbi:MAG: corrinoid protein [Fimbriimonadaceae bacterium]|nr:corrinoid protein [Fimbriimonadaceae bacterium]